MLKSTLKAAVVLAALIPSTASAYIAQNGLQVRTTGAETFNVPFQGSGAVRDFWCAAGDYVIHDLNLPRNTRIYRTSPVPRRSGQGIEFSLSPENAGPTGLVQIGGSDSLSAVRARFFCEEPAFRFRLFGRS